MAVRRAGDDDLASSTSSEATSTTNLSTSLLVFLLLLDRSATHWSASFLVPRSRPTRLATSLSRVVLRRRSTSRRALARIPHRRQISLDCSWTTQLGSPARVEGVGEAAGFGGEVSTGGSSTTIGQRRRGGGRSAEGGWGRRVVRRCDEATWREGERFDFGRRDQFLRRSSTSVNESRRSRFGRYRRRPSSHERRVDRCAPAPVRWYSYLLNRPSPRTRRDLLITRLSCREMREEVAGEGGVRPRFVDFRDVLLFFGNSDNIARPSQRSDSR